MVPISIHSVKTSADPSSAPEARRRAALLPLGQSRSVHVGLLAVRETMFESCRAMRGVHSPAVLQPARRRFHCECPDAAAPWARGGSLLMIQRKNPRF